MSASRRRSIGYRFCKGFSLKSENDCVSIFQAAYVMRGLFHAFIQQILITAVVGYVGVAQFFQLLQRNFGAATRATI